MKQETKFKDTEIGKIPADYSPKEIRIGTKVFSGFAFKSKDMNDEWGIPVVKIKNIHDREVTLNASQFFPEELVNEKLDKFFLEDRDILIAMTGQGSVGRVGQIRLSGEKALLNQRVGKFIIDEEKLDRDYLYFVISSPRYEKILFDTGSGSGQPNLSPNQILSVEIPLPRIEIQMKISEILRSLNDRIYLNQQMNKTLEAIGQALFKHWFIDFEFPNEEGKPYKSSSGEMVFNEELGKEIPKGWEVGKLKSLINRNREKIETKEEWKDERIIDLSVMPQFSISLDSFQKGDAFDSNIYKMKVMDILFGSIRPYFGKAGFSPISGVVTGTIFSYLPKDKDYYSYILFLTTSKEFIEFTVRYSKGTKMPIIGWKDFISYKIALPKDEKIISQFNFTMLCLINKILKNIQETHNLSKIRDSLLPKLMSGKIRVPVEVE